MTFYDVTLFVRRRRTVFAAAAGCVFLLAAASGTMFRVTAMPKESLPALDVKSLGPYYAKRVVEMYRELQSHPSNELLAERIASVLHYRKQHSAAEEWFHFLSKRNPGSARYLYELGLVQAQYPDFAAAVRSFATAVRLDSRNTDAKLQFGLALLETGKIDESLAILQDLVHRDPRNHYAYYGLGRLYAAKEALPQAIGAYRKALDLLPDFKACRLALAHALILQSKREDAERELAAAERPGSNKAPWEDPIAKAVEAEFPTAAEWVRRGGEATERGDPVTALRANLTALEADPERGDAQINLILLYAMCGETEKSAAAFQTAVARISEEDREEQAKLAAERRNTGGTAPGSPAKCLSAPSTRLAQAHLNFGLALMEHGKLDQAERVLREGLGVGSLDPQLYNALGALAQRQNQMEKALGYYRQAVKTKPDFPLAQYNLGRLLFSRSQFGDAEDHFLLALDPEPQAGQFLDQILSVYAQGQNQNHTLGFMRHAHRLFAERKQEILTARIEHLARILGVGERLI